MARVQDPNTGEWYDDGSDGPASSGGPAQNPPSVGADPWGQLPGDPSYGYPPGTNPTWDNPAYKPTTGAENPTPTPTPTTTTTGQFNEHFSAPDWMNLPSLPGVPDAPQPDLPTFRQPDAFAFHAPSIDEAMNDPGYKFRVGQGADMLQRWAAARGTLNDTGTANALQDYGQNAGSQEYANVWNRDWQSQKGQYDTNYQTQFVDPYKFKYQAALDTNAPRVQAWQAGVDNNRLGYQTQAADVTAHNSANYASAWNSFMNDFDKWKFNTTNALGN